MSRKTIKQFTNAVIGLSLISTSAFLSAAPAAKISLDDVRYPHSGEPVHHNSWEDAARQQATLDKAANPIQRPASFDVQMYDLDIKVDPMLGTVVGTARLTIKLNSDAELIQLDAVDMAITEVKLNGAESDYWYDGEVLSLSADGSDAEQLAEVSIAYEALSPQSLRITGPDATDPNRMIAAYTFTQPLGSRYWFPCLDRPSDKALAQIRIEVPEGFNALSNGNMIERRRSITGEVFAYRMDQPIATYLMSLAIGQYEIYNIGYYKNIPLYVWTPEAIKDRALIETSGTQKMMEVFSEFTGTDYPFPLYSQSVAQAWGSSMEHQSATTMGGMRITGDLSGEGVVAHELAHQWFGDFVTCEIWEELWLNEGFASYLPMVYFSETGKLSDALGYFDWWRDGYFSESKSFVRALSTDDIVPGEMFDSHSYEKGALVIHMMRTLANAMPNHVSYQENFSQALQLYFEKHGLGNVRYQYLQAALEEVTATSWQTFFTQWVRSPGHPILDISYETTGEGSLKIDLEQLQATREERRWRTFSFPLELEVILADGRTSTYTIDVFGEKRSVTLSTGANVVGVVANPQWIIPAEITIQQGLDGWLKVLQHSRYEKARLFASRQIAKSLKETEAPASYIDALAMETSLYVIGDAVAELSSNTANRDHVERLLGLMNGRLDLDRIALSTIARAESWLVQTAPDAPTRDDEVRWQAEFEASSIQAVREAIINRLAHADLERTQSFILSRFEESHWSSRDRASMIDWLTKHPTPTSAPFIAATLEGKLSVYWLARALGNLATIGYENPEQIDLMVQGAQNHRYSYGRYSFLKLLAEQSSSKDVVCPQLLAMAASETTEEWSETTYESIRMEAAAAVRKLGCE